MNRNWRHQVMLAWVGMQLAATSVAQVVINEIHYDPDIKTEPVEFIELHNPSPTTVDLSGWDCLPAFGSPSPKDPRSVPAPTWS
jgi:hypothetical protein